MADIVKIDNDEPNPNYMDDKAIIQGSDPDLVGVGGLPKKEDCLASRINQFVERGNHWVRSLRRSDLQNYSNGEIQFAFEYVCAGDKGDAEVIPGSDRRVDPSYPPGKSIEPHSPVYHRPIWNRGDQPFFGDLCVVYRWDQEPVFVRVVGLNNNREKFISSSFAMKAQCSHGTIEPCSASMGVSILKGFMKSICLAGEGELDRSSLLIARAMRRDDLPIGMIETGPNIVNDVPANQGRFVHNGFVIFDEKETLSGFGICFNNPDERSLFVKEFVKFADVFRCPINL